MLERTDNCEGFVLFNSWQGVSGTGLAARFIETAENNMGKAQYMFHSMWPEDKWNSTYASTIEPYNFFMLFYSLE